MTDRYAVRFAQLRKTNKKAFIPFTLLGWPDGELSLDIVKIMIEAGVSAIELGWAFSDPIASGKLTQAAAFETLATGFQLPDALELIRQIRLLDAEIPIGLLMYHNMITTQGSESFFQAAAAAGVDSVLIADLPTEAIAATSHTSGRHGVAAIFMLSPMTSPERRALILEHARGFIYVTSGHGLASKNGEFNQDIGKLLKDTSALTTIPLCVGLGTSTPQQARAIIDLKADGVISGSRIIEIIDHARASGTVLPQLQAFLTSMLAAVNE